MPSSKKSRGRQRRANKEASDNQLHATLQYVSSFTDKNKCTHLALPVFNHGVPPIVIDAHKVYMKAASSGKLVISAIEDVRRTFPSTLEDKDLLFMLILIIVSVGTQQLIKENLNEAYYHAVAVLTLENHPTSPPKKFLVELNNKTEYFKTWRDLKGDRKLRVTEFFAELVDCNCLLDHHLEDLATKQMMGICYWCKQEKPFDTLMECTGCEIAHYCSEECQKLHLPRHEGFCTMIQTTCLQCKKRPTITSK